MLLWPRVLIVLVMGHRLNHSPFRFASIGSRLSIVFDTLMFITLAIAIIVDVLVDDALMLRSKRMLLISMSD